MVHSVLVATLSNINVYFLILQFIKACFAFSPFYWNLWHYSTTVAF